MSDLIEANPRAVIGNNNPPLAEMLAEHIAPLQQRANDLVAGAARAGITDDDTAGKGVLLAGMILAHIKAVDAKRVETKAPYLEAGRLVDTTFNAVIGSLATYDAKGRVIGGPLAEVSAKVDTYRRKKEAEAAAERKRLEDEARKQREAAEAAVRAQREAEDRARRDAEESARKLREAEEAARVAGNRAAAEQAARERVEAEAKQRAEEAARREAALKSEIEQRQANDAAAALERQAAAVRATPIDSGLGVKAHARKSYKATITDLTAAIRHSRKVDEAAIKAAVQQVYDRQVRAGVRELPGAEVTEDSTTTFRAA